MGDACTLTCGSKTAQCMILEAPRKDGLRQQGKKGVLEYLESLIEMEWSSSIGPRGCISLREAKILSEAAILLSPPMLSFDVKRKSENNNNNESIRELIATVRNVDALETM